MLAMPTRNFRWIGSNSLALALFSISAMSSAASGAPDGVQEKLLQVDINRQQINETVLLLEDTTCTPAQQETSCGGTVPEAPACCR
jgi:hypothetical protein